MDEGILTMAVTDEYLTYVKDQLDETGTITSRRMFGGAGIYGDGLIFAIVVDDVLYFKVDDSNRADYEAAGMEPFTFTHDKGQMVMGYYEVPIDVLESKEKATQWARQALAVAQAARKTKTKPAKKAGRPGKGLPDK